MPSTDFAFSPFEADQFHRVMPMLEKVERRARQPGLAQKLMVQRVEMLSYMDVIYRRDEMLGVVVSTPTTTSLWVDAIYLDPHQLDESAMVAIDAHLQARARVHALPFVRGTQQFRGGKPFMERAGWRQYAAQYERKVSP